MADISKNPVHFNLPDGYVDLIPWAYALTKITEGLTETKTQLGSINTSLKQIEDRIDYWLGENIASTIPTRDSSDIGNIPGRTGDDIFNQLYQVIAEQAINVQNIADKLDQLEIKSGSGGNGFVDYVPGTVYKRNQAVIDTITETAYRVVADQYTAVSIQDDTFAGKLKLLGFESQIVTFSHDPSQEEINVIPDDAVVIQYSPTDPPYDPET